MAPPRPGPGQDAALFHRRVALVDGTDALLSLSDLRTRDEAAYQRAIAKYDDTEERRQLRDAVIPLLQKRWTEVVFLSPVHPHAIWRAWREVTGETLAPVEFWSIPAASIAPRTAVIYNRPANAPQTPIATDRVTWFEPQDHAAMHQTTPANMAWLRDLAGRGGTHGAWWNLTPHVLVGAPVSLAGATVISWDEE